MEQTSAAGAGELLSARLSAAAEALATDTEQAATGASEVLDEWPGQQQALLVLLSALRLMRAEDGGCEILEWMAGEYAGIASIQYELGLLLGSLGRHREAIGRLNRVVELEPSHPAAWRELANLLGKTGDVAGSTRARARHIKLSLREIKLIEDASEGPAGELDKAERMLVEAVELSPTDMVAVRTLGNLYLRMGKLKEAAASLARAVDLAPTSIAARSDYCMALIQRTEWKACNEQVEALLGLDPGNPRYVTLKASNLAMLGEREEAVRLLRTVSTDNSDDRVFWLNYGHAARTIGQGDQPIIDAYRKCLALDPTYGAAWWGLADLKTYRFTPEEIATMRTQAARSDVPDGQRCHIEFALGNALETEGAYAESFEHYRMANELRRPYVTYSADLTHQDVLALKAFFTPERFAAHRGMGCPDPDPIFIVGLPRSGSTLVEQILSSHSRIEGTMELPDLGNIVNEMIRKYLPDRRYPEFLTDYDGAALRRLGEDYLARTRMQRVSGKPFFTDKMGNNFLHAGLIQLILPNARIIDARRHPLACCFSIYKQAFAPGAMYLAYDQTEIARYYRDYVEMMAHYDSVSPGRIFRVIHEELVEDPDRVVRAMLDYLGLPFEESCLRFYETDRSVRTASSQQVRQPIRKKKVEPWQHYEAWLQPMKDALGSVLSRYPEVPAFD
ncbi:MAG TPA: sulfotransferase [Rhizomicrobium sp.]|jgi:tetratricopeptide (TPR) repeat protein|nr:sulfotransferase [Rhizomicrobium sp.]